MITTEIKNQLMLYIQQYQETAGTFAGFQVIYEYINFIKTEPYTKELLGDIFSYVETQKQIALKLNDKNELEQYSVNKMKLDANNPPTFPFFQQENENWQGKMKAQEPANNLIMLPICLLSLIVVYDLMVKAKNNAKAKNITEAERLAQVAKEVSLATFSFTAQNTRGESMDSSINVGHFQLECLAMVSKYIFDQIDSQDFIADSQPKNAIEFDPKTSILNIRGTKIKIARKNDNPTDHYILEAICDNPDKTEETYFKDIAQDYIKVEGYDSSKDWQRFRHACDRLNRKVDKSTKGRIKDFILYSTGKTGWSKINPKYL